MTDQAALANGLDETHAPRLRSWVPEANGHPEFPIQNLPLGVFSPPGGTPRIGTAIGDQVLDLAGLLEAGFLTGAAADAVRAAANGSLNGLLALGAGPRKALRARLSELLREGAPERDQLAPLLSKLADCTLHLPARIGDYTDFYVGIHHATEVGKLFRPDNPLLPNYKYVPIGYHGRASSIRPSGTPVRRPNGQTKAPDAAAPVFGPSRRLDYELELGIWVGPGNEQGEPVPVAEAADHIAGFCLLNDWSARDVQAWEYQPLGPFLAKNFASTISPWIITPEALAPFRIARSGRRDPSCWPTTMASPSARTMPMVDPAHVPSAPSLVASVMVASMVLSPSSARKKAVPTARSAAPVLLRALAASSSVSSSPRRVHSAKPRNATPATTAIAPWCSAKDVPIQAPIPTEARWTRAVAAVMPSSTSRAR